MNTEIFEYFKNLSQKDYFWINLIDSFLGLAIIVLGILGMIDGMTISAYAFMFAAGGLMFVLNAYKGRKNKNRWLYLAAGIAYAAISVVFFIAMLR